MILRYKKMTLKYKIIICFVTLIAVFFAGRLSRPEAQPATVKTQKEEKQSVNLVDTKQEEIKSKTIKHKNKIKLSEKKPDGSEKTLEIISNDTYEITSGQILNLSALNSETRTTEKIELKTPRNNFALEMQAGIENSFTNFSDLPKSFEFSPNLSAKLNYRLIGDLWAFTKYKHEIFNNNNFYEIGILHRLEF